MASTIKIKLDTSKYKAPTQDDIKAAKQYILQREEYASILEDKVDGMLEDAASRIVTICYRFDFKPEDLVFSSSFNEDMMNEISDVMDEIESEIYDYIFEYSTRATNDRDIMNALVLWMATLGRGNKNLRDTLDGYLFKFMKDIEASVAAYRFMGVSPTDAVTKIRSNLHNIYNQPEVLTAFRRKQNFNATYIRLGGVQPGAVGISNNGSTNVVSMSKITLQMAWMRAQAMEWENDDSISGYYQLRGSSYLCDLCDEEVGFHPNIEEIFNKPYPHSHCLCFRVPIHSLDELLEVKNMLDANNPTEIKEIKTLSANTLVDNLPSDLFDTKNIDDVSFKIAKGYDTDKTDYKDLLNIAKHFASLGKPVALLKPYHVKSEEYKKVFGSLAETKYWGKNPDLLVGNNFYEYESYVRPFNNKKVGRMISHGMAQSDKIIIDNMVKQEDWYIQKLINARLKVGATIDEVWLYERDGLRQLFKQ